MKKLVISLISISLVFWLTVAYTPTTEDVTTINQLRDQLDSLTSGNMQGKAKLYIQLKNLQEQYANHEKLEYYLNILDIHLITQINAEKVKAKVASTTLKQAFVNTYSGNVSTGITTADTCTGRYNTLDSISFANNFPTAMTVAMRYRETTCGYYLPSNGDGPFQILSKNYGTGTITEGKFLTTIQDYLDFSKNKYGQYYSKIWPIFTYTGFDMTGLVNYAALYNWGTISGNIVIPNNPNYVYDGYGEEYSGATKYGIIPKFIKALDWELKNSY